MILHCVGQGEVVIPGSRDVSVLDDGVMQVPVEVLLDISNIFNLSDASDRYLFPLLLIRERSRHDEISEATVRCSH